MHPEELDAQLRACVPRLRRYARALTGDQTAADDLVQDTLERAWKRLSGWRGSGELRAWLFSIMHNLFIDQRRQLSSIDIEPDTEGEAMGVPVRATQTDGFELRDLDAALARLPVEQREVLLLVALEQMSYHEIASSLAIPIGTVMSRLSRGRARLRAALDAGARPSCLSAIR